MMPYQPLEDLLPKARNSVYRVVKLASKRAKELAETGGKLIQTPAEEKLATTALNEILQGKVVEKGTEPLSPKEAKGKKHA